MSGRPVVRRSALLAAALLSLGTTTACVSLPDTGPVRSINNRPVAQTGGGSEFRPAGPVPGQTETAVVEGFLAAMTATPVRTDIARKFLTAENRTTWDPTRRIVTYQGRDSAGHNGAVDVKISGARWIDERGQWRGRLGNGVRTLRFPIQREDGQFRIARAPNALIVPGDWFQERGYRPVNVYYLDPTARIIVPQPVFVPQGDQLATFLVQALLQDPGDRLTDVSRTFVPPGLSAGLSVPVSSAGVATINLQGDAAPLTPQNAKLMVYQFAWTLKQDPDITGFRITIGDQPVTLEGGGTRFSVDLGSEYDPNDVQSSDQLFAVHNGVLEAGDPETLAPVTGPFGATDYGIDDVGVSLRATEAAATLDNRTMLSVAPVSQGGPPVTVIPSAADLLKPAWDFADRLWVVDRTSQGAKITVIDLAPGEGKPVDPLDVPGISGKDVKSFLVSRDGTRLVAVVRGRSGDEIRVSRIRHTPQGQVLSAGRARPLSWAPGTGSRRIRDIGWRSTTTVAVLHTLSRGVVQIVPLPVDGSPMRESAATQRQRAKSLVGSPVPNEPVYTLSSAGLTDPTGVDNDQHPLATGITVVHYAG
jgi:hypothetical protein